MKKILIVGDSHVGALKTAAKSVKPDFDVKLHFLAAMGPCRQCLNFDESGISIDKKPNWHEPKHASYGVDLFERQYDRLIDQFNHITSKQRIKYSDYSSIVLVGGDFFNGKWFRYAVDTSRFSKKFLYDLFLEYRQAHHGRWLKGISKHEGKLDVYSLTEPLINEVALANPENASTAMIPDRSDCLFSDTYDFVNYGVSIFGSKYVRLPEELISKSHNAIKAEFRSNNPRDMNHLNAKGGEIRLRNLLHFINHQ